MKIIAITSSEGHSGGVRQAEYQTECFRRMGHDAMLALPYHSHFWKRAEISPWWLRLPPNEADYRPFLEDAFGGPGILHAFHNRAVKLAAWWGLGWRKRGISCVAHRGIIIPPKNPLPYWSPGIRFFLPNSRACARTLRRYCLPWRIRVVPNGVPEERVRPGQSRALMREKLGLSAHEGLVLGYTGNDNPLKGSDTLILAFARAVRLYPHMEHVRLLMIGASQQFWGPQLEAAGVSDRVIVVTHSDHVSDELQVCDAFVFPSRGMDSAPNVLLEAVRMGLPAVSTDVGGCPEIMDGNGIMVRAGHVEELADAMAAMCADEEKRRVFAAQSLVVGARYTVEARCQMLLDIYEEVAAR